jgi:hypothetical protein
MLYSQHNCSVKTNAPRCTTTRGKAKPKRAAGKKIIAQQVNTKSRSQQGGRLLVIKDSYEN